MQPARMSDGDEESFELYALAASMLEDCKQAGQLSDLSTIIWLLREALTYRSGSHLLQFQSTCRLAAALLIQSSRTDKLEALDEAMLLKEVSELNPEIAWCARRAGSTWHWIESGTYTDLEA